MPWGEIVAVPAHASNALAMSGLVITDSHIRLPTRGLYWGNSSFPPGSPSFLGPRSTPGLPGILEVAEISYKSLSERSLVHIYYTKLPVTHERTTSLHLQLPLVFNWVPFLNNASQTSLLPHIARSSSLRRPSIPWSYLLIYVFHLP